MTMLGQQPPAEHGGHDGHSTGTLPGSLKPKGEHNMRHAFVMVGSQTLFLVHMTMFDMEEHCYQLILRATLPESLMTRFRNEQSQKDPVTFFVGSHDRNGLTIADLAIGTQSTFKADVFRDIPKREKSEGWPWDGHPEYLVEEGVDVQVDRVVYARHFDFGLEHPKHLTYILFGTGQEAHLHHFQTKDPDFDHVLTLNGVPDWLPPAKLEMAIHVTFFALPTRCADPPHTYCENPIEPRRHSVQYYGQGDALDLEVGRTLWCSAAVVNQVDPCAPP